MNKVAEKNNDNDVKEAFEYLEDILKDYEGTLMEFISAYTKTRDINKMHEELSKAEKVKNFLNKVSELKLQWQGFSNDIIETKKVITRSNEKDVHERTEWKISSGYIKIETERFDGPPYSNVFPVSLFIDISKIAIDFAQRNGFVKTSDILKVLENKIISSCDYKKTPRLPVYASFKVLVKQGILKIDENNSHKYVFNVKLNDFNSWINNLPIK